MIAFKKVNHNADVTQIQKWNADVNFVALFFSETVYKGYNEKTCQCDAFLEKDVCEKGRLVCLANNIELYRIWFVANYSIKLN